jgi:superfamily II DNA/RNA helicase
MISNLIFSCRGIPALGIHGDKTQMQRSHVIRKFKSGDCRVMIATDVAARGLDINDVEYVVNYDFPLDIENYVHRIGRTARSNKTGTSVTLITDNEAGQARRLITILRESSQPVPEELLELSRRAGGQAGRGARRGPPGPLAKQRTNDERSFYNLKRFSYKGIGGEEDMEDDRFYHSRQRSSPPRNRRPNWDDEGFVYDKKKF